MIIYLIIMKNKTRVVFSVALVVVLVATSFWIYKKSRLFFETLPGSPVYLLKIGRERLASFFVFGYYDSSLWHLTLADKRIVEAESLLEYGISENAFDLFMEAREESTKAVFFLKIAKEKGEDINFLKEGIRLNLERQLAFVYRFQKLGKSVELVVKEELEALRDL